MPSNPGTPALGYEEQIARCIMAGTDMSKHPAQLLLEKTDENGQVTRAYACPGCGAHTVTVTDKNGLQLTPIAPFTWPSAMKDRLDRWNRR
jgi:Zn finger protein HypA/HybF involved in hydrogenase expression